MPTPFSEIMGNSSKYTLIEPLGSSVDYTNYDNVQGGYNSNDIIGGIPSRKGAGVVPNSYKQNNGVNHSGDLMLEPHLMRNVDAKVLSDEKRELSAIDALQNNVYPRIPPQVSNFVAGPGIAGAQHMLKDATDQQPSQMGHTRIREGFKSSRQLHCMDVMNHIRSCPLCSRYHSTDAKVYHVLIFMLIILFVVVLYFISKEERR